MEELSQYYRPFRMITVILRDLQYHETVPKSRLQEAVTLLEDSQGMRCEGDRKMYLWRLAYMFADHDSPHLISHLPYNISELPEIENDILRIVNTSHNITSGEEAQRNLDSLAEHETTLLALKACYDDNMYFGWYSLRIRWLLCGLYLAHFTLPYAKHLDGIMYAKLDGHLPQSTYKDFVVAWCYAVTAAATSGIESDKRLRGATLAVNSIGKLPYEVARMFRVVISHYVMFYHDQQISLKAQEMLLDVCKEVLLDEKYDSFIFPKMVSMRIYGVWLKKTLTHLLYGPLSVMVDRAFDSNPDGENFSPSPTYEEILEVLRRYKLPTGDGVVSPSCSSSSS